MNYGSRVEYEWDDAKNNRCIIQRGFSFAYAVRAFSDPQKIVVKDTRMDYGEDRYQLTGVIDGRTYVVIYTPRGSAIRIISARKANWREAADYEHNANRS